MWQYLILLVFAVAIGWVLMKPSRPARRDWLEPTKERTAFSHWNLELLRTIEWKRFEEVCAAYFETIGFRTKVAREGADGGIDIHLFTDSSTTPAIVAQCKAWNTYKVGIKPVRELFGVMAMEGVSEGIFLTTGVFTAEARAFPRGNKLHLWDGNQIVAKILDLPEEKQQALLRLATKGDFRTPTCPSCAIKMVVRTTKRNGERFWGCGNYPQCKQTFKLKS